MKWCTHGINLLRPVNGFLFYFIPNLWLRFIEEESDMIHQKPTDLEGVWFHLLR
jgi:hypothetical protein